MHLITVGHSNLSFDDFLAQISRVPDCKTLVDIRSFPGSRMFPQYNQAKLKAQLTAHHWQYHYLGKQLGPRNHDEKAPYHRGKLCYKQVLLRPRYQDGITLLEQLHQPTVVLMATKADVITCHRFMVLSRLLLARGHQVSHLVKNTLLAHSDYEQQMITKYENRVKRRTAEPPPPMATPDELLAAAYFATADKAAKDGLKKYAKLKQQQRQ